MDKDLIKWNIKKVELANLSYIKPAKEKLPAMLKKYKDMVKSDKDKRKLKVIENYHNQIILLGELMNKWKKDLQNIASR